MWNFDPKSMFFAHTKTSRNARVRWVGGPPLWSLVSLAVKYISVFFRLPYELNKKSARQLLLPTAYQSVDISREFHKVVQTRARPLTPPLWEANQTERGKTGSAIFSITQPKISQMLPKTENTWELNIFQNGLLEQLKRISKKLKPNYSPKCCQSISAPFFKISTNIYSIQSYQYMIRHLHHHILHHFMKRGLLIEWQGLPIIKLKPDKNELSQEKRRGARCESK